MYEIKSGVRRSREIACDAMASAAVGSPAAYARRLLALAEAFGPPRDAAPVAMALIGDGALEERLMHLIGGRRAARPSRARAAGALAVGAALLAPVLCLHVAPALAAPSMPAIAPVVAPAAPIAPAPVASTPPPLAPIHRVRLAHAMRAKPALIVVAVNEPAMAAQPPVPPAPPAPLAAPPAPPVPPVPPAPPAVFVPPVDAAAISARIDAAMARAQRANAVAMAQLRAHSGELSSAQRAQMEMEIRRSVQEAMEESRREVHAAMDSPEVRRAMSEAKMRQYVQPEQIREQVRQQVRQAMAEAMRAMSEAQAGLKDAPGD